MALNPFSEDIFLKNVFGDPEFDFRNPLTDQRQAILMEIDPVLQTTRLAFSRITPSAFAVESAYYYVNLSGTLTSYIEPNPFTTPGYPPVSPLDIRWLDIGGAPPPLYLIMTDELGGTRFITSSFFSTPSLVAFGTGDPAQTSTLAGVDLAWNVGPYLELIGQDGHSIYRLTINSSNIISVVLDRDEPERAQSITISNGHSWAFYNGRTYLSDLIEMGDVDTQAPLTEDGFGGLVEPTIGLIRISIHDGELDFLTDQDWDSRPFTVRIGSTDAVPAIYPFAIRGEIESATWDEDFISLRIRDAGILFKQSIQPNHYGGTGGLDGDSEVEGQPKPLCLGFPNAVEPRLIDRSLLLYQVHDGDMRNMDALTQGGVFYTTGSTFSGDIEDWVPTQQEIDDAAVLSDTSQGVFRLSAPPGGRVMAFTTRGESGIVEEETVSDICRWIVEQGLPDTDLDLDSFTAHKAFYTGKAGIYVTEERTIGEVLTELVSPVGIIGINRLNRIFMRTLGRETPLMTLTQDDIQENTTLQRQPPPKPGSQHRIGHSKAYTVLTESDFLGAADPITKTLSAQGYRYRVHGPYVDAINDRFPSAKTKTINTNYLQEADARFAGDLIRHKEQAFRDVYSMIVLDHSWEFRIGDTFLFQFPRFRFQVPRVCVIIGITEMSPTARTENLTKIKFRC